MKNAKKKSPLFFVAACTTVLLTGCGEKDSTVDYSKYVSLPDYSDLSVDRVVMTVTDDDVQEEIDAELSYMAETTEITDRAAADGDLVVIDFTGTIDGAEFEDGSAEDYELELGSDNFIDGFEDQIVGMEIGETKDIEVTFPDPYDGVLDGETAVFSVTLNEIYEVTLPDYDAEFVSSISDYSSTEEYEAALKEELQESYDEDAQSTACENALYEIISGASFSGYPEDLYEECQAELESENQEFMDIFGIDDITELYGDDYDEEAYVLDKVYERMVVYMIASKEDLEVTDEEYESALEEEYELYAEYDSLDELKENTDEEDYRYQLLYQEVLDFLAETVTFTDVSEEEYYADDEDWDEEDTDEEDTDEEELDEEELDEETEAAESDAESETETAVQEETESGSDA